METMSADRCEKCGHEKGARAHRVFGSFAYHGEGPSHAFAPQEPPAALSQNEQQRRSFAYGNANIDNPNVTRAMVDAAAEPTPGALTRDALREDIAALEKYRALVPGAKTFSDLADVIESLQEQNAALRARVAEAPNHGEGLTRYGIEWRGPTVPLAVEMNDGYWTPWHLASNHDAALRAELEKARAERDEALAGQVHGGNNAERWRRKADAAEKERDEAVASEAGAWCSNTANTVVVRERDQGLAVIARERARADAAEAEVAVWLPAHNRAVAAFNTAIADTQTWQKATHAAEKERDEERGLRIECQIHSDHELCGIEHDGERARADAAEAEAERLRALIEKAGHAELPSRDTLAKIIYETSESLRAADDGEPGLFTPWEAQTSRREQRIYRGTADAVLDALKVPK